MHRLFILLLLMLATVTVNGQKAEEWYTRGIAAESRGHVDTAISYYSKAIKVNPDLAPAYERRAALMYSKADYRQSLADYRYLLAHHSITLAGLERMGNIAQISGLQDTALYYYRLCRQRASPENKGYYDFLLGEWFNGTNLDSAIAHFSKAEAEGYVSVPLYWQLGSAYIRNQQMKLAAGELTKAIDLEPANDTLYSERAYALLQSREYELAAEDYRHFLLHHPRDIISLYGLGQVYYSLKQYDSAISCFHRVTAQNQSYYYTWGYMGLAMAAKGDFEGAVNAFSLAIRQNPQDGNLYYNRGIAKGKLNPDSDFCDDFRKARDLGDANGRKMWETYCNR